MRRLLALLGLGGLSLGPDLRASPVRVVDLRVYPVKSCGGISVPSARMAATGLEWDRVLAVTDGFGYAQTQRLHRRLAAIRPGLDAEAGTLTLQADGMEPLTLPLAGLEAAGCRRTVVRMGHGDPVPAWRYPAVATEWLTQLLSGSPGLSIDGGPRQVGGPGDVFHLARYDEGSRFKRQVANDIGGDNALPEDQVAFPDLFPLLLTAQESLDKVNQDVPGEGVGMDRFRPNIVVAGAPAFDEDTWAVVELGGGPRQLTLRCLEQDPRCQIPSIDQRTGEPDARFEPARALRASRRLRDPAGRAGRLAREGPMFGVYAAHGGAAGELRVGDALRVVERSAAASLHEHWTLRGSKRA